ncbi:DUF6020 family protein [Streptomyces sp. NPDC006879]|uniref:DUF6020 family protein n=1 Tax=Streptomyces sp. NPDC006879 TaxID=3364767 RepID=UPI0036891A37
MKAPNIPVLSERMAKIPPERRLALAVYATTQLVLLIWWLAFYPGGMSYDSISYVWHVTTGHWMSNHSVAYDGLVWLSLNLTGDLAALTFLQTVAMAATLAYAAGTLREFGVRGRWAALAALACTVLPSVGVFTVYVWKDVPFTIGAVLAFAAAGRLARRRIAGTEAVRDRAFRRHVGLLFLGFLAMALFRNNGLLVALAAAPLLLIVLPKMRRWLLAATVIPVVTAATLNLGIYPALGVKTPTKDQVYAFNYADIAVAYGSKPDTFTKADTELMAKVAPLEHWGGKAANCYNADWAMQKPMDRSAAEKHNEELLELWGRILKRTPDAILDARICRAHIAWAIFPGPAELNGNTLISVPTVPADLFGWAEWNPQMRDSPYRPLLKIRPVSQELHDVAYFAWKASRVPQLDWLLYRGAIWCYAAYAIVIAFSRRNRQPAALALLALPLALQLTVLAANPAPLFRYMVAPIFIGLLLVPLLGAKPRFGQRSAAPRGSEPVSRDRPEPEAERASVSVS